MRAGEPGPWAMRRRTDDEDALMRDNLQDLPGDLPVPVDDGGAAHLPGRTMPAIELASTRAGKMRVDRVPEGFARLVLYAYPRTGRPGEPLPDGWDAIPGARGCTPESCGFRD